LAFYTNALLAFYDLGTELECRFGECAFGIHLNAVLAKALLAFYYLGTELECRFGKCAFGILLDCAFGILQ